MVIADDHSKLGFGDVAILLIFDDYDGTGLKVSTWKG